MWVAENIDRPALHAIKRMVSKRYCCSSCGFAFFRNALSPHLCPDCGSDELVQAAA